MKPMPWEDETIAANGRRVKENFTDWFGASKVVDEHSQALMVFHGTSSDINSFDPSLSGRRSDAPQGTFFFTDKPDVASSFTIKWQGDFSATLYEGANVMPVYLAISKPLKVNAKGENWNDILFKGEYRDTNEIAQMAKDSGKYDGVIITRVRDKGAGDVKNKTSMIYIAFDPGQVKSAISNSGLYLRDSKSLDDQESSKRLHLALDAINAVRQRSKAVEAHP